MPTQKLKANLATYTFTTAGYLCAGLYGNLRKLINKYMGNNDYIENDTKHLLETTTVEAYKTDANRIARLKLDNPGKFPNQRDIIKFLLDYWHDNELISKNNA